MNKPRIYTITKCPYCAELKQLLTNEGIEFTEVNVDLSENSEEYKRLVEFTKRDDVPVIKIESKILVPEVSFKSIRQCFEMIKKLVNNSDT